MIRRLRAAGGDSTEVEVKSAAGGLPSSLTSTLSALANQPGGGTIILGLDEKTGFRAVGLSDVQTLKQGLAAKARAFTPPVRLTIDDAEVDGAPVIVAQVHECDRSTKPCRVTATGTAYLRAYDGDYALSGLEEQGFLAGRRPPHFDRSPVEDGNLDDLDVELVDAFLASVRDRDPSGLGRFPDDAELLRRAGVTVGAGQPTVAGLLALGVHPQQWFPRYVVQAAAQPLPTDSAATRARNQITISGPIPRMLDTALAWARRTFDTAIVAELDGSVHDRPVYPLVAFRELVANALIHRDLDHWSAGLAVEVRLLRDRLVVGNPGGLYGITVDRLGRDAVTSARNARLVSICQHVRAPETGARVIEALATGIPTINEALAENGLPPAHYIDSGIRFTVVLHAHAPDVAKASEVRTTATLRLGPTEGRVYDSLATRAKTVDELSDELGLSAPNLRKTLRRLRDRGLVLQQGGKGQVTVYQRAPK
ncbi:putative DNA binding domain-containing protein [Frankia sp. AgB1.9]|uniref:ATP-binding protein n=1 Tax=unclassified Frankia TaxID=2632575 RepID=UPI001932E486|nr:MULTISPECIES: ATP-binding protein [unclassified Frankia]MBL7492545.1 putative DNA binding domain-containing protein [Frankia sp. AgW1.1]MBL7546700.1 putative DNA binding domain-containing protein [Frankia sp. AgB1.9]MBL7622858.1 putative DNA binding domain-containing protein [Frankia sp. AgB1.8]